MKVSQLKGEEIKSTDRSIILKVIFAPEYVHHHDVYGWKMASVMERSTDPYNRS